jgi:hypothetical protein
MLARPDTKVRGRFCVKRCGPSRRRVRTASAVLKNFVRQPEKTFQQYLAIAEVGPNRSPRQHGREARAAFAINYDGNPGQDGRPAGPALQV